MCQYLKAFSSRTVGELGMLRTLWICWQLIECTHGFNLDTANAKIFRQPANVRDTHFGFSVGLLNNQDGNWLLAGAPKSSSEFYTGEHSVENPGALFKCPITQTNAPCEEIKVTDRGNICVYSYPNGYLPNPSSCTASDSKLGGLWHDKNHQWFGATMDVQDRGGPGSVIACAPHWQNQYYGRDCTQLETCNNYMNGYCWELNNDLKQVRELYPLAGKPTYQLASGAWYYGVGMAGWSVHYPPDGNVNDQLLIGAPGVWEFSGSVIDYDGTRTVSPSNRDRIPLNLLPSRDLSLIGYSISSGVFFPSGNRLVVAGAPRFTEDERLRGMVIIYEGDFVVKIMKNGTKMGEYYGAAVAAIDINNDGLSDLLVGGPYYYDDDRTENGRVYVYMNQGSGMDPLVEQDEKLEGRGVSYARFGTVITDVGDLDLDGYKDVAIGAPNEDGGAGALYIYRGHREGVHPEFSQRIAAADIDPNLRGFGWSISKSLDLDNNNYPDVAVGAYESSAAVVLAARPVLDTDVAMTFNPSYVNTAEKKCRNSKNQPVPCVDATTCFTYTGAYVPVSVEFYYTITSVTKVGFPVRAVFSVNGKEVDKVEGPIQLLRGSRNCVTHKILISNDIRDKLNPLTFTIDYAVNGDRAYSTGEAFPVLPPVISANSLMHIIEQLKFSLLCGSDEVCTADLAIVVQPDIDGQYIVPGRHSTVKYVVSVDNKGENAYETQVHASYSKTANFIRAESMSQGMAVTCLTVDVPYVAGQPPPTEQELQCDVANPLGAKQMAKFYIELETSFLVGLNFTVGMTATTTSNEPNTANNKAVNVLQIRPEADVHLTRSSTPEQLLYMSAEQEPGLPADLTGYTREFQHVFDVYNRGPSTIESSRLRIQVPHYTHNGDELVRFMKIEVKPENLMQCNGSKLVAPSKTGSLNEPDETIPDQPSGNITHINCTTVRCETIECQLATLLSNQNVYIRITGRIKESTFLDMRPHVKRVGLQSAAEVTITSNVVQPMTNYPDAAIAETALVTEIAIEEQAKPVAWWIYLLSILAGIIVLAIIVFLLVKFGFFKRKTKDDLDDLKRMSFKEEGVNEDGEELKTLKSGGDSVNNDDDDEFTPPEYQASMEHINADSE
ncbi:PREDICTED: integrin alpha-9-like [Priapulus caudatus]|uniref:Integrin alpha-9-like n=1 Tax=Priapulus caudatus TaxID=37621 RepID=A0ABM1ET27_PRICU|nr:PREDICTED: integrin alpha-9-like [Priapulus caudatus]